MPRDGDVRYVDVKIVYVYQQADESVGIFGGWYPHTIKLDGAEHEFDIEIMPVKPRWFDRPRESMVVDAAPFQKIAEEME